MGLVLVGVDGLRVYLSGAATNGGAQADPDQSRGRHRSSTEFVPLSWLVSGSGLANLTVDFVSGATGPGVSTLEAVTTGSVRFVAPGGEYGEAVAIANGETRVVASGDDPSRYVRVTRTSGASLSGTAIVTTADLYANAVGMAPVGETDRAAGLVQYRLLVLKNESAGVGVKIRGVKAFVPPVEGVSTVDPTTYTAKLGSSGSGTIQPAGTDFRDWPASGWALVRTSAGVAKELVYYTSRTFDVLTIPAAGRALGGSTATAMVDSDVVVAHPGIAFAFEEPASQPNGVFGGYSGGFITPTGLTWSLASTEAGALVYENTGYDDLAIILNGESLGLWIRWDVPAGATGTASPPLHLVKILCEVLPT